MNLNASEVTALAAKMRDDEKDATFAMFAAFVAGFILALIVGGVI